MQNEEILCEFQAKVVKGLKVGSKFGVPTINLDNIELEIEHGVYFCLVEFEELGKYKGVMHYGPKSFTPKDEIYNEIFIYEFSDTVYDKVVDVKVLKKIRDVRKFNSKEELFKQIKQDISNGPN